MSLVWEDLSVVLLPNLWTHQTRKLLNGLNGQAEPGRLVAIMGPSGSGKSTLLDSLSGMLPTNAVMTGKVSLNGKGMKRSCREVSYVMQEDVLFGTLTVKETMAFSANLRLPARMTKAEINEIVSETISSMGLEDCADKKVGNWHSRGISSGEKKRLTIGLEILTSPKVLFLDEPTSSLDSASAFYVMKALKHIACEGRVVVSSVHQPSSELFEQFDDLVLLSGGESVYSGDTNMAVKFFADAGVPCPTRKNPADHFLKCICPEFDVVRARMMQSQRTCDDNQMSSAEIKDMLLGKYKCYEYSTRARTNIEEKVQEILADESNSDINPNWRKQLRTLVIRCTLNMSRDLGYYWLRILFYLLISASLGSIFHDIGKTYWEIVSRGKIDGFIYSFMLCLSVAGLPSFIEEMKVSRQEMFNGHYGKATFIISNMLSSLPFLVIISFSSGAILHFTVRFHPGFSRLIFLCLNLLCCVSVVESCMMITASLVPNLLMGIGAGAGVICVMMLASSISRRPPDLPDFFWHYPMSYISFASWGLQGHYKNEMIGLEFESWKPGAPRIKGETIIETGLGISLDHSKWWDLAAVVSLVIFYRTLFFVVLKFRRRILSFRHKLYVKKILKL